MPACMKNLLVKVQRLQLHCISQPVGLHPILRARLTRQRPTNLLGFEGGLVGLEHNVIERVRVVYSEVIVVGPR